MKTPYRRPNALARAKARIENLVQQVENLIRKGDQDRRLYSDDVAAVRDAKTRALDDAARLHLELGTAKSNIALLSTQLKALRDQPVAYSKSAARVAPIVYWASGELLGLLHALETERIHAEPNTGVDGVGQRMNSPAPFPIQLLEAVSRECVARGLVARVSPPEKK